MKKRLAIRLVILAIVLVLLGAVVLYYINRYRPVPLLDSGAEVTYIALKYEASHDESQEITNYDETALLNCLSSCEMKWLQSGKYGVALGREAKIDIMLLETGGSESGFIHISLGERKVVMDGNDVYEIIDGDKVYEAVMELIKDEIQDLSA